MYALICLATFSTACALPATSDLNTAADVDIEVWNKKTQPAHDFRPFRARFQSDLFQQNSTATISGEIRFSRIYATLRRTQDVRMIQEAQGQKVVKITIKAVPNFAANATLSNAIISFHKKVVGNLTLTLDLAIRLVDGHEVAWVPSPGSDHIDGVKLEVLGGASPMAIHFENGMKKALSSRKMIQEFYWYFANNYGQRIKENFGGLIKLVRA